MAADSVSSMLARRVALYPRDLPNLPAPPVGNFWHRVHNNTIVMNGGKCALVCAGDCANSGWQENTVTGFGQVGILIKASLPSGSPVLLDTLVPSNNSFTKNDLK